MWPSAQEWARRSGLETPGYRWLRWELQGCLDTNSAWCVFEGLLPELVDGSVPWSDVVVRLTACEGGAGLVRDIEEAGRFAGVEVLLNDAGLVLHRHFPSAELDNAGAETHVSVVEDGSGKCCHGDLLFHVPVGGGGNDPHCTINLKSLKRLKVKIHKEP